MNCEMLCSLLTREKHICICFYKSPPHPLNFFLLVLNFVVKLSIFLEALRSLLNIQVTPGLFCMILVHP